MWGAIAKAVGGIAGAIGGSAMAHEQSKSLNRQMFQYNNTQYQNRFQWAVEDAEKAGLNPAIVAGGGAGSIGSGSGGSGNNPFGTAESMITALSSAEQAKTQSKLNEAEEELTKIKAVGEMKRNGWIDKTTEKAIEEAGSRILNNQSTSALNAEKRKEARETAKFQRERSRGYSQTVSVHAPVGSGSTTVTKVGNKDVLTRGAGQHKLGSY